ncbi:MULTISPECIES: ogr/Delta-like zinc finger family protein [Gibbsiella]|uniref:Prophage transcriptional regulator OgrK n=1 Tax=Gibbsiella dentisursi TaxID=796890 RepID=A0ABP7M0D0_9GAMM|nr:ogr/Delta-like zinc finger family protein [Gibbsiella quercinecans]
MMHCPLCGNVAHTRSSRYLSNSTKERYHQCQNIHCSCTFATHESVARVIAKPSESVVVQPQRPAAGKQPSASTV